MTRSATRDVPDLLPVSEPSVLLPGASLHPPVLSVTVPPGDVVNAPLVGESTHDTPTISALDIDPPTVLLPHRFTGMGKRLLDLHRRLGHPHDRLLKRMVDRGTFPGHSWVPAIIIRQHCVACQKAQQQRQPPVANPSLLDLYPEPCMIMAFDYCGPHHIRAHDGSLYWFLGVCPNSGFKFGACVEKKSEFIVVMKAMLGRVRSLKGVNWVCFLKCDGAREFETEEVLDVYRTFNIDYSVNCPDNHAQTGVAERGHGTEQRSMRPMQSYAQTPSVLWPHLFLLSVELHNLRVHKQASVCPYFLLTGLEPDKTFLHLWGCTIMVHRHNTPADKMADRGFTSVYLGTGSSHHHHAAKVLNPATGAVVFTTDYTTMEHFLPFKELTYDPGAVRECYGVLGFRNLVGWTMVGNRVRKSFNNRFWIGFVDSYHVRKTWCFRIKYSDGSIEEYTPSELASISYDAPLSKAFFLAFELVPPLSDPVSEISVLSALLSSSVPESPGSGLSSVSNLLATAPYSVDAHDSIFGLLSKPADVRHVVPNPAFPLSGPSVLVPRTYLQAQQQPEAPYWEEARQVRLARHEELGVYDVVDHPHGNPLILDTKWVFDVAVNSVSRMPERFKVRLVANGSPQILGVDVVDIHAPTAPIAEFRLLLAIAADKGYHLYQLDAVTAFISGDLAPGEVIWARPPRDINLGTGPDGCPRIWSLKRPLEGTRPSAMRWHQSMTAVLKAFGFLPIGSNQTFWKFQRALLHDPAKSEELLLCTHVDDAAVGATSDSLFQEFVAFFSAHFQCKWSILRDIIGLHVIRNIATRKIYLSQEALTDRLLEQESPGLLRRQGLTGNEGRFSSGRDCHKWSHLRPVSTPFDVKMSKISLDDCPSEPDVALVHSFRVVIGILLYLTMTRLDILHAANQLARVVHNPGSAHVLALDHLLRYLAGTSNLAFVIGEWDDCSLLHPQGFHGYADASHKNSELAHRGITGYCIKAFGTILLARSTVQSVVSASSCEAEYYAYSTAVRDVEYLRLMLRDLGFPLMNIPLLVDNQPAISVSNGHSQRSKTRHIDFTKDLCQDYVTRGLIAMHWIPSEENLSDIWTKQLPPGPFLGHRGSFMDYPPLLF